jgi:hypothetical protein
MTTLPSSQSVPHWGDFQSLFQLSIALNTGFAILLGFIGNALKDEADASGRLVQEAHELRSKNPDNIREIARIESDLITLEDNFRKSEENYFILLNIFLKPFFIVLSFLSFLFLILSSYYYNFPINILLQIYAITSFIPFLGGLGYAGSISHFRVRNISNKRRRLQDSLRFLERRLHEAGKKI